MGRSRNINELFVLTNEQINEATEKSYRQYFCGDLKRPQILDFIKTEALEVGMSDYREPAADEPHYHRVTADMIHILEGEFRVKIIEEDNEIVLRKGDFISVPPMTPYASKAAAGTKTLFIKTTKGNDKVNYPITPELEEWLSKDWEK